MLRILCDRFDSKRKLSAHQVRDVTARPITGLEGWSERRDELSAQLVSDANCTPLTQ